MKPFLATPTTGTVRQEYAVSLAQAFPVLGELGPQWELAYCDEGWTALARNKLVTAFLSTDCDPLVFIDSDIRFKRDELAALLAHAQEIDSMIGAFYPLKILNWGRGVEAMREMSHDCSIGDGYVDCVFDDGATIDTMKHARRVLAKAVTSTMHAHNELASPVELWSPEPPFTRVRVDWVPTGFLAIRRKLLLELREMTPQWAFRDSEAEHHAFFQYPLKDGTQFGEDNGFSKAVRMMGKDVWKLQGTELGHLGGGWEFR